MGQGRNAKNPRRLMPAIRVCVAIVSHGMFRPTSGSDILCDQVTVEYARLVHERINKTKCTYRCRSARGEVDGGRSPVGIRVLTYAFSRTVRVNDVGGCSVFNVTRHIVVLIVGVHNRFAEKCDGPRESNGQDAERNIGSSYNVLDGLMTDAMYVCVTQEMRSMLRVVSKVAYPLGYSASDYL